MNMAWWYYNGKVSTKWHQTIHQSLQQHMQWSPIKVGYGEGRIYVDLTYILCKIEKVVFNTYQSLKEKKYTKRKRKRKSIKSKAPLSRKQRKRKRKRRGIGRSSRRRRRREGKHHIEGKMRRGRRGGAKRVCERELRRWCHTSRGEAQRGDRQATAMRLWVGSSTSSRREETTWDLRVIRENERGRKLGFGLKALGYLSPFYYWIFFNLNLNKPNLQKGLTP